MSKTGIKKGNWRALLERDGANCSLCHFRMIFPAEYNILKKRIPQRYEGKEMLEYLGALDFIRFVSRLKVPGRDGGGYDLDNLVGAHFWCNNQARLRYKEGLYPEQVQRFRVQYSRYIQIALDLLEENERVG